LHYLELDLLPFFQGFEAFRLDGGEVYEYVILALDGNESIPLFGIEPFDCACFHAANPPSGLNINLSFFKKDTVTGLL
jgi:hypothetical protein